MCRHLAYLGPPISLAEAVITPEHSLLHQSWAPKDMRCGGTINADGFGAGWYPPNGAPVRYRRDRPLWTDNGFAELVASVHSGAFLAAARSATVGMPVVETACAPFSDGRMLFSHNGVVAGWPSSVAQLAAALDVTELLTLDAPTDSALLWALVRARLRDGLDPVDAVSGVAADVLAVAPTSRLNLLLTDGSLLVATTWWHSLSVRHGDNDGVLVASEPLDAHPGWTAVPDAHLLVARRGPEGTSTVDIRPLPDAPVPLLDPDPALAETNGTTASGSDAACAVGIIDTGTTGAGTTSTTTTSTTTTGSATTSPATLNPPTTSTAVTGTAPATNHTPHTGRGRH